MGIEPTWASLPRRGLTTRLHQHVSVHLPGVEPARPFGPRFFRPARLPFRHQVNDLGHEVTWSVSSFNCTMAGVGPATSPLEGDRSAVELQGMTFT
jgi:hypothetical protein